MWSTRPLPFADPDTWQRLRAVIDTVGQWKASVVQIGGRLCWPLWRGVHELDEVLTCFHRRPAGARGAGYCAGQETPTADATAWGCRFVRGVDLEAWGHRHAPWYHFGQLTDGRPHPLCGRVGGEWLCGALRRARSVQARGHHPHGRGSGPGRVGPSPPGRGRHVPTVRYADVAGQAAAVQAVRDVCELPLTHGAYFAALGLAPPRGVLLYGPPGNGKTLLAQAVATETAVHLEIVSGPEILSPVGGGE